MSEFSPETSPGSPEGNWADRGPWQKITSSLDRSNPSAINFGDWGELGEVRLDWRILAQALGSLAIPFLLVACGETPTPTSSQEPPAPATALPTEETTSTSDKLSPPAGEIPYGGISTEWTVGLKQEPGITTEVDAYYHDSYATVSGQQIPIRINNPWAFDYTPNPDLGREDQERLAREVIRDTQSALDLIKRKWPGTFHFPTIINIRPGYPTGFCVPRNIDELPERIPMAWTTGTVDVIEMVDLEFTDNSASSVLRDAVDQFQVDKKGEPISASKVVGVVAQLVPSKWCPAGQEKVIAIGARFHELNHLIAFEWELGLKVPTALKEGLATHFQLVILPELISPVDAEATAIVSELKENLVSWNASQILTTAERIGKWENTNEHYWTAARAVEVLQRETGGRFLPEITAITQEEVNERGSFVKAAKVVISNLHLSETHEQLALWLLGQ